MENKKWIRVFITLSLGSLILVGMINYIIDPLWTFSHKNSFNSFQEPFNEREQKINKIYFNGFKEYDSLLLGSSLTTYIDQNDFSHMKVYNMGAGNMYPSEYKGLIDTVKKINHNQELKYIIIGMDFFTSATVMNPNRNNLNYLIKSETFFYRYKMIFSYDTLKYSLKNIINYFFLPNQYYTRDNIRMHQIVNEKERRENTKKNQINNMSFFVNYSYNIKLFGILKIIKDENPHTKFIIFTTPAYTRPLGKLLAEEKNLNAYKQWLKDIIDVFGTVYHFYDFNSITMNKKNYFDGSHYYPCIGTLIAKKILNTKDNKNPNDFGSILSDENIETYLKIFKEQLEKENSLVN